MRDTIRRLTATGYSSHRPVRARPAVRRRYRPLRVRRRLHPDLGAAHEGTSVAQLGEKLLRDVLLHVVAPRVWT